LWRGGSHRSAGLAGLIGDDRDTPGNPGLTLARQAVLAVGRLLATPEFGPDRPADASDFNELHRHRGLSAVLTAVRAAGVPGVGARGAEAVLIALCAKGLVRLPRPGITSSLPPASACSSLNSATAWR
jgi:hypothetical protein